MGIETITISQLTKDCIDNHDVMCNGVHCVYRESIDGFTGKTSKDYIVLNYEIDIRFKTLARLKSFIKGANNEND